MKAIFLLFLLGIFCAQRSDNTVNLLEKEYHAIQVDTVFFTEGFANATALENAGEYEKAITAFWQLRDTAQTWEAREQYVLTIAGIARNNYHLSRYNRAIALFQEGLSLANQYPEEIQEQTVASMYVTLGACYGEQGDIDKEMNYLDQALDIFTKNKEQNALALANCYNDIGLCYGIKGNFEKELSYLQEALALFIQLVGEQHPETANCYSNISICFLNLGDYHKQLEYAQKSLYIRQEVLPENHPYMAINYNIIGQYYGFMGEYEKQLTYIQKALQIVSDAFGEKHFAVAAYYSNLGRAYEKLGNPEKSLYYARQALNVWIQLFGENHPYVADAYFNIGTCYGLAKKYDQQRHYLQKSIALHEKISPHHNPRLAITYDALGKWHVQQHNYDEALVYFQKALLTLTEDFKSNDSYTNPSLDSVYLKKIFLEVLANKSHVLENIYKTTGDEKALKFALSTMHTAIDLVDTLRFEYTDLESRQYLEEKAHDIFGRAIHIAHHLHDLTQNQKYLQVAFTFAEKSRANSLIQSLNMLRATHFANIPDSLIQWENDLKSDITYYEKQLFEATQQRDSTDIRIYQNRLFDTKTQYYQLIGQLEQDYPKYYQLKYDMHISSLEEVQQQLSGKNELLVSYFTNDTSVFAFGITQDTVICKETFHGGKLKDWVGEYRKSITDYQFFTNQTKEAEALYTHAAYQLYQLLLAPVLRNIPENPAMITIIPDGEVWSVNFDLLLDKPHRNRETGWDKNLAYLIHNYTFSYSYSATLNTLHQPDKSNITFAGFAPSYANYDISQIDIVFQQQVAVLTRSENLPLPGAMEEVTLLSKLMEGDVWTGKEANETNFKKYAKNYGILHLAMHAQVNPDSPKYSCFLLAQEENSSEDGALDAAEIYAMELNAKMAVLSACNSGWGEIRSGDGMSSLARAFAYAGCPSLVMSTWKVPDASTKEIMLTFYKNLRQGQSKHEALRNAKLPFLETANDQVGLHPYNWAGLAVLGDTSPITSLGYAARYPVIIASVLVMILLVSFIYYRKKSKKLVVIGE